MSRWQIFRTQLSHRDLSAMAYPFGGHPTLQRFVEEAQRLGCIAEVEVRETRDGRAYAALVIRNQKGGQLTIPNPELTEHLSPSVVSHYQRRLSIRTDFAAQPEQSDSLDDDTPPDGA